MALVLVVLDDRATAMRWLTWLRADLGDRGLWAKAAQAAAFAHAAGDAPAPLLADEPSLPAVRGQPLLAGTPAVLVGGTLARARELGCLAAVPPETGRAAFAAGLERALRRGARRGREAGGS